MGNTQSYHPTITRSCINKQKQCLTRDSFFKVNGNQTMIEVMGESSKFFRNLGISESNPASAEDKNDPIQYLSKKCNEKYPGTESYINVCCDPNFKGKYDKLLFSSNNGGTIVKNSLNGISRSIIPYSINLTDGTTKCTTELADEINQEVYKICDSGDTCDVPDSFKDNVLKLCTDKGYNKVFDNYQMCQYTITKKEGEFFQDNTISNSNALIECAEPLPYCDMVDNLAKIDQAVADAKTVAETEKTKAIADVKATTDAQIKAITDLKNTTEAEKSKMIADLKSTTEAEKQAILDKMAEDAKEKEKEEEENSAFSDRTWMIIIGSSVIGLLLLFIIIVAVMRR